MKRKIPFGAADILLPKEGHEVWACIACDQFTSQRAYWEKAYAQVGDAPSSLHIIFPEVYLEDDDREDRIQQINRCMEQYLKSGVLTEYKNAMILVERTMHNGSIRRGIVGAFALADYSFASGEKPLIRPTEGTVLSRIPPRVAIRKEAALELPHIMVLMDDRKREIVESIDERTLTLLYDFPLMLNGGHLRGWLIDAKTQKQINEKLQRLAASCSTEEDCLLFAVGDGNHSLATAKAVGELIGTEQSRYALAELVNIHDAGVVFEPIYRVLFHVDTEAFLPALLRAFPETKGKQVKYFTAQQQGSFFVEGLEADVLQAFLDRWIDGHPEVQVDYIHGESAVRELAQQEGTVGFLFGGMEKEELFPYVSRHGILPRKTFSIGEAEDKRYYMEARRIR